MQSAVYALFRGDAHRGLSADGYDRRAESAAVDAEVLAHVDRLRPRYLVDLGDGFDVNRPFPLDVAAGVTYHREAAARLARWGGEEVVLLGNHDRSYRDAAQHALAFLPRLNLPNVTLVEQPMGVGYGASGPGFLAFPAGPGMWTDFEAAHLAHFAARWSPGKPRPYLVLHLDVEGVGHGTDEAARGTRAVVPAAFLARPELADRLFMGHVHAPADLPLPGGRTLHVVGATVQRTFARAERRPRLLALHFDGSVVDVPLEAPRALLHLRFSGPPARLPRPPAGALVRVELTLREDQLPGFDAAALRARLEASAPGVEVLPFRPAVLRAAARRNPAQTPALPLAEALDSFIAHRRPPRAEERRSRGRALLEETTRES